MASALGISQSALRRYRRGTRPVPLELLNAVTVSLRYQAERLATKAAMLDSIIAKFAEREDLQVVSPDRVVYNSVPITVSH